MTVTVITGDTTDAHMQTDVKVNVQHIHTHDTKNITYTAINKLTNL